MAGGVGSAQEAVAGGAADPAAAPSRVVAGSGRVGGRRHGRRSRGPGSGRAPGRAAARLAAAAPALAAFAVAVGVVAAVGSGPLASGWRAAVASWAEGSGGGSGLRGGVRGTSAAFAGRGVYYGWVAPRDARVWLEGAPCTDADPPARVTLEGGSRLAALLGRSPPPLTVPLDGAAIASLPGRSGPVPLLDVGSGLVGGAGPALAGGARASGAAPLGGQVPAGTATYARVRVDCRSWREAVWDAGALGVAEVDGLASDDPVLAVHLVPEPAHTGLLAVLLLQTGAEPVTVESVGYAPDAVATGRVLVGVGRAEHWPEWIEAIARWSEAGGRGEVVLGPPPARPYWLPDGPTPPLAMADADDLALMLEPHASALVAIGNWSFGRPPERLLTFPTVSYVQGGVERSAGLAEPLYQVARPR